MFGNYKLDEQAKIKIKQRHIKTIGKQNNESLSSTTPNLKHQNSLLKISVTPLKYPQTKSM